MPSFFRVFCLPVFCFLKSNHCLEALCLFPLERFHFCSWQAIKVKEQIISPQTEVTEMKFRFLRGLAYFQVSLLPERSSLRAPAKSLKCMWGLFFLGRCLIVLFPQPHENIKPLSDATLEFASIMGEKAVPNITLESLSSPFLQNPSVLL